MKMPKAVKRGESYRIKIMIAGKTYSVTKDTVKECEQWAAQKMLEAKANKLSEDLGVKSTIHSKHFFINIMMSMGESFVDPNTSKSN